MKHYFRPYLDCKIFIETGSSTGEGITAALNAGFDQIISIELSEQYYGICQRLFKDHPQVKLILGNSVTHLPKILEKIDERCVFWLDAHWCGGMTAGKGDAVPLINELKIIASHHIKEHTIIIDDMRMLREKLEEEWKQIQLNECDIQELLYAINPNYKITYEHVGAAKLLKEDILVARI
jgi:hypothetical protein